VTGGWAREGSHSRCSLLCLLSSVWETYSALDKLRRGENQALWVGLDSSKIAAVQACLTWRPEGASDVRQQQDRMRQVLERLATRGFVPLRDHDDEVAKVKWPLP
jgi:hypothetical protein